MMDLCEIGPRTGVSVVVLALAVACGSPQNKGSQAASERQAAQTPEEIEALFSREKEVPATREVKAPTGAWNAQFPSETEVNVTAGEGHTQAEFSLGTEAKTRCVFYDEAIDAGQTIGIVLDGLTKKGTLEKILPYRVTAAQGVPIVFLEARYTIPVDGGKQAGSLKLAVSPRLKVPALCFLDEPGYAGAFATAITQVLESFTTKEAPADAVYSEVWASSMDGTPFGFQWLQMLDEGAGKRTTITLAASFIPVAPGELAIKDEVEIVKSDANGVVEGSFYETEGSEIAHEFTLQRSGKAKYAVTGKVGGKDFKSEFNAPKLPDDIESYRLLRANHKKTTKLSAKEFAPSFDPGKPVPVNYSIDGQAHTVTIQMGDMSLLGTMTDEGLVSEVATSMGEHEFKQTIIHRSGKF